MHPIAQLFVGSYLAPEYKRTIEALDSVFDEPLYFFFEDLFEQTNMDLVCDRLGIARKPIDTEPVNKGTYGQCAPQGFIEAFCSTKTFKENVAFVNGRFNNVPWSIKDYEEVGAES
jgi:hypothetical protein